MQEQHNQDRLEAEDRAFCDAVEHSQMVHKRLYDQSVLRQRAPKSRAQLREERRLMMNNNPYYGSGPTPCQQKKESQEVSFGLQVAFHLIPVAAVVVLLILIVLSVMGFSEA